MKHSQKGGVAATNTPSLQAIRDAAFSHKSDVFSFGVLMWEICSLGKPPCESLLAMPRWLAATPGMSQNASISVFAA